MTLNDSCKEEIGCLPIIIITRIKRRAKNDRSAIDQALCSMSSSCAYIKTLENPMLKTPEIKVKNLLYLSVNLKNSIKR